jgi:hypothetical protein
MYTLKFQAPKDQVAKYRKGQLVRCDYYPNTVFKVVDKSWDINGVVYYTLERHVGAGEPAAQATVSGLREKYLSRA